MKLQRCHLCFEVRTTAKTDIQPLQPSAPRSLFSQLLVFVCSSSVFLTGALQQCTLMTYEMVYCASTVPSSPSTRLRNSTNYWPNKRTRSYDIRCQTLRNADHSSSKRSELFVRFEPNVRSERVRYFSERETNVQALKRLKINLIAVK